MINKYFLPAVITAFICSEAASQCASAVNLGSSANIFTFIRNSTRPVAVDNTLNTVVLVHRNNPSFFGGSSGHLRYDVSTNGGATWNNDQGVLNPNQNLQARYPSVALYNPTGNITPGNAYLTYMGATISNSGFWAPIVTGVRQLNGSGTTESYNQPGAASSLICGSLVKGAPGVFWATDNTSNGTTYTGGITIYKGIWNTTTNDINWSLNTTLTPGFNLSYSGAYVMGDINIAFDPAGVKGWISIMMHSNTAPSNYGYYPVFYKTENGGATWSGPIDVNLSQLNCITNNIQGGYIPSCTSQGDLTVDAYGNPHLLTVVGYNDNAYALYYQQWHHAFDITQFHGIWTAYDVAAVRGGPGYFSGSQTGLSVNHTNPQVARSSDGKKIFFGWTDNQINYSMGDPNILPDFMARGFDVQQNTWTPIKDFTSCNFNISGSILFMHMAKDVLEFGGNYKLAPVYAKLNSNMDTDQPVNFRFLNNCSFSNSEFNIGQTMLNLSISQGSTALLCQGNSINLQAVGNYQQIQWSGGNTSPSNVINSPGVYYVAGRSGCTMGLDSIVVKTLTMSATSSGAGICLGKTLTLTVTGNAYSYLWTPGNFSGTTLTVTPSSNTTYYVTGSGDNNCTTTTALTLTMGTIPTIVALANKEQICAGEEVILQAAGADIYVWSNGGTTFSTSATPSTSQTYTVTGLNTAGCSAKQMVSVLVNECTAISENASKKTFLIYPNPAAGTIFLKSETDVRLKIMTELGQVVSDVYLNSANGYTANITGLSKGVYVVLSQNGDYTLAQKIVVQ